MFALPAGILSSGFTEESEHAIEVARVAKQAARFRDLRSSIRGSMRGTMVRDSFLASSKEARSEQVDFEMASSVAFRQPAAPSHSVPSDHLSSAASREADKPGERDTSESCVASAEPPRVELLVLEQALRALNERQPQLAQGLLEERLEWLRGGRRGSEG